MRVPIPRLSPSVRALCISVLVGAIIGLGGSQVLGQGPSRPNILLLFADDQRADTIAAWGNPHIRTPNLDRLARAGPASAATTASARTAAPSACRAGPCS